MYLYDAKEKLDEAVEKLDLEMFTAEIEHDDHRHVVLSSIKDRVSAVRDAIDEGSLE